MHDGGAKAPPKHVRTMIIQHSMGTKSHPYQHVHITHHHSHSAHPATSHVVPVHGGAGAAGLDELHDHMEEHMGQPNPGEQECEDGNCE